MSELDIAVANFKVTVTKKSYVVGVSRNKIFDYIEEKRKKEEQALKDAWKQNWRLRSKF